MLQSSGCVADIQYIARLDADQGFSQGLRSDAGSRSRGILSGMGPRYLCLARTRWGAGGSPGAVPTRSIRPNNG